MRKSITIFILLFFCGIVQTKAQTASTSDNLVAHPIPDRTVAFDLTDPGISKTVEFGADLAWANEQNFRRAIMFMGHDQLDVVRASFQPTYPLVNGDLQQAQIDDLNWRLYLINTYAGPNTNLVLNSDHPSVDDWYQGNPANWEQLIQVTAQRFMNAGHNVITVGAFNEPDYGWGQGTIDDMYNITALMNNNPFFNNIRLSGGNTLNCDEALSWYNHLTPAGVNEGNTHQLAGSFNNFASFLQAVRGNGHHASLDEMHNVVEGLAGYEYGMQTGIWWGPAELARGEMVKAFDGQRIGYAEHRPNWTAAAVYRTPEGRIQAFGGTSERQAVTTTYNYLSKDRVVYFDGHGPQREFVLEMPGGTGYQQGQTNAERVVNITWGDDIQPVINGRYIVVNRNSGLVMEVAGGSTANGANVQQGTYTGATSQQWDVVPVDSRIGGDFSYFSITSASNGKSLDDDNWSLDNGANIMVFDLYNTANQQRYLEYVNDGYFYIRSRHSTKCLDVFNSGTSPGDNIVQWDPAGGANQQWRLIPVGAPVEFVAPGAPGSLIATAQAASIRLDWTASPAGDVAGYTILRSTSAGGAYNTIARNVTAVSFVDNTTLAGVTYYYAVRAEDHSLNRSANSNQVSATATGDDVVVAEYKFDGNTSDASANLNHSASYGSPSFGSGHIGSGSLHLDGVDDFVQLPADIANHQEITIAAWIYRDGGGAWQRVFDFGNSQTENMFLTSNNWAGEVQFTIVNNGASENLYGPSLPTGAWHHVAVTLGASGAALYVNGQLADESASFTISPLDFKPVQNYIGRSLWPDPLFDGRIDDFRVYNYVLSGFDIAQLGESITYYQLRNRGTGLYLDGMGRTTNGDNCGQYANTAHINSHWAFIETGDGFTQLKNRGTGLFLDGMGRTTNGSACGQWASTNDPNSQWSVQQFSGNYYRIQNRSTGLYVDGYGYTTNGANVNQYANTTHQNAQWELVQVSSSRLADESSPESGSAFMELTIYPNPAENVLHIEIPDLTQPSQLKIFDLSGTEKMSIMIDAKTTSLNIGELSAGTYIMRVDGKSHVVMKR